MRPHSDEAPNWNEVSRVRTRLWGCQLRALEHYRRLEGAGIRTFNTVSMATTAAPLTFSLNILGKLYSHCISCQTFRLRDYNKPLLQQLVAGIARDVKNESCTNARMVPGAASDGRIHDGVPAETVASSNAEPSDIRAICDDYRCSICQRRCRCAHGNLQWRLLRTNLQRR